MDPFNLDRFVAAQEDTYPRALAELRAGLKRSHWMWFVFPQIEGLGHSAMAERYAIRSLDAAVSYLRHPILGARLRECTEAVLAHPDRSISQIFGYPDDLKFRSSITLFDAAAPDDVFRRALDAFFGGEGDPATLDSL